MKITGHERLIPVQENDGLIRHDSSAEESNFRGVLATD
jgi:hypothetical protein